MKQNGTHTQKFKDGFVRGAGLQAGIMAAAAGVGLAVAGAGKLAKRLTGKKIMGSGS